MTSMLSKDVAYLSGVTVRTLRHYHQIGILPEPPRLENGYRDYGVVDVARVLRIKRLASLGLSLEQIGSILKEERAGESRTPNETAKLLDDIDNELKTQISQLEERRRIVSLLRKELNEGGFVLEASAPIRDHVSRMVELGANSKTTIAELHQLLLVDDLEKGSTVLDDVLGLYQLMEERGIMAEYIALTNKALTLPDNAGEKACAELATRIATLLSPVIAEYLGSDNLGNWDEADPLLERLIRSYDEETLSPLQAKLSRLAEKGIRNNIESLTIN
ncbi:MAG TPA: MerR family DNA-binding transcriptional regulator [Eggerthellaceae bacterium]|nr:MerR family DNA-binding transcriptional regulator [Eggerthellaceae bacterium]